VVAARERKGFVDLLRIIKKQVGKGMMDMLMKTILPNGLTIITYAMPQVWSVAVGIWIGTGSRYENAQNNGISHFIEHMLFKGTTRRTARQIAEELEAVGGQLNAFTSKEHTCYYAKVLRGNLPIAVDVLSDMVLNPLFDASEIERERGVVIEEIKMYDDTPEELVFDLIENELWGNHGIGWPISGSIEVVQSLTREAILDYYHHYYVPNNIVVVGAGNVEHHSFVQEVAQRFGSVARGNGGFECPAAHWQRGAVVRVKDIEQVHLCLGLPGYSLTDPEQYALQVLNNILGGGMSSRLFQEIREKRGLAYSVYSSFSPYADTGLFAIYAGTSGESAAEVVNLIMQEFAHIKERGFTAEEFRRAKESLKGSLLLSLEGTTSQMLRIGKAQLSYGRVSTPEELIAKLEAVQPEDVARVAQDVLDEQKCSMAIVGEPELEQDLRELAAEICGRK